MSFTDCIRRWVPRSLRNALRRPSETCRRWMAKLRHGLGVDESIQPSPGWLLRCHPLCIGEFSAFETDPEQRRELQSFVSHCRPGMQFMDVGSHWGMFTLAALHHGGPEARSLAVEASDAAAAVLAKNLALNGVADRVALIRAACGDCPGTLAMLTTGAGGADYFVVPDSERPDCIRVEQVTIDQLVEKYGFQPTHLKVDVEGYEQEVLAGAGRTLRELRPLLFLELHGDFIRRRGGDPEQMLNALTDCGYVQWRDVEGNVLAPESIRSRQHNLRFLASPEVFYL
jgi:FkbM family methyltransferase